MSLDFSLMIDTGGAEKVEIFSANITHNLGEMAKEAGIYDCLWRPDEHSDKYRTAKDLIPELEKGLKDLKKRPEYFRIFDSPNGWGLYIHFVPFVEEVLEACKSNPLCEIEVSR